MCQRLSHSMLASVVLLALVCMQTPCIAQWGDPSAADKKIIAALDSPTVCEFKDTPLEDIVEELQKRHGVNMRIDERALDNFGVALDAPITFNINGISLRSALRLMLRAIELTYIIEDGFLVFTSQEAAADSLSTRVYPVDDLIGSDNADKAIRNCERLDEVLQSVVLPNCWVDVGGNCSISAIPPGNPQSLVVRAHQDTHELIREVLHCLRQAHSAKSESIPVSIGRPLRPREKKIAAALHLPTNVDFKETPLREALRSLGKQHDITIHLDERALDNFGVEVDTPISKQLDDVPLRSVLHIVLHDLELTYHIENEVLLITTPEMACSHMEIRVYPLANVMPQPRRKFKARIRYADALMETLTNIIDPGTWVDVGGMGDIEPLLLEDFDVLVISQTPEVHEQIAGILLRKEFRQSKWVRRKDAELPLIPGGGGMGMF